MNVENENPDLDYIPDDDELILEIGKEDGYDDSNSQMAILLDNIIKYYTFLNPEIDEADKWKQLITDKTIPNSINKLIVQHFKLKIRLMNTKDKITLKQLNNG